MFSPTARFVWAHLEFCTPRGQTQWFLLFQSFHKYFGVMQSFLPPLRPFQTPDGCSRLSYWCSVLSVLQWGAGVCERVDGLSQLWERVRHAVTSGRSVETGTTQSRSRRHPAATLWHLRPVRKIRSEWIGVFTSLMILSVCCCCRMHLGATAGQPGNGIVCRV